MSNQAPELEETPGASVPPLADGGIDFGLLSQRLVALRDRVMDDPQEAERLLLDLGLFTRAEDGHLVENYQSSCSATDAA